MKAKQAYSLKVVTVDDSPIIVERLQAILAENAQVVYVGNATRIATAVALIEREQPHVVILDISLETDLPQRNGIDLLIILRKKFIDMKIIMLTNLNDSWYRNTCLLHGADYFLDKSNEFEMIAEIVSGFTQQSLN